MDRLVTCSHHKCITFCYTIKYLAAKQHNKKFAEKATLKFFASEATMFMIVICKVIQDMYQYGENYLKIKHVCMF